MTDALPQQNFLPGMRIREKPTRANMSAVIRMDMYRHIPDTGDQT